MALPNTNVGPNPQIPYAVAETFLPDQLIAGVFPRVTDTVTIAAGADLPRGTVLGKITASGKYIKSLSAAADGSQTPAAILVDFAGAAGGDVLAGVYLTGEFNQNALTLGAAHTAASIKPGLRTLNIFLKDASTAADPT